MCQTWTISCCCATCVKGQLWTMSGLDLLDIVQSSYGKTAVLYSYLIYTDLSFGWSSEFRKKKKKTYQTFYFCMFSNHKGVLKSHLSGLYSRCILSSILLLVPSCQTVAITVWVGFPISIPTHWDNLCSIVSREHWEAFGKLEPGCSQDPFHLSERTTGGERG